MSNKIVYLGAGLIVSLVILLGVIFFVTGPDKVVSSEAKEKNLTSGKVTELKTKTEGLRNFGNLPQSVTGDDLGRSNPFEAF